ncbi:hypothetical protein LSAT2_000057 [Lamellibrachia satsuma]|nr:hypothetical protein LSAT2_000057 [Lamellibrachia satsuma]
MASIRLSLFVHKNLSQPVLWVLRGGVRTYTLISGFLATCVNWSVSLSGFIVHEYDSDADHVSSLHTAPTSCTTTPHKMAMMGRNLQGV